MDKRKKQEQEETYYNTFLSIRELAGDNALTSKEISELLKEYGLPSSLNYVSKMIQMGLFDRLSNNKYRFIKGDITMERFFEPIREVRGYNAKRAKEAFDKKHLKEQGLREMKDDDERIFRYINFLKDKGYKIQRPRKVERIVYETIYEDC